MEIIEQTMVGMNFNENELTVVKRMIHTTGILIIRTLLCLKMILLTPV